MNMENTNRSNLNNQANGGHDLRRVNRLIDRKRDRRHRMLAGHEMAPTMLSVAAHIRQAYGRKSKPDLSSSRLRTERTLAGSFASGKRRDGTIEHNTLPWLGGSATLSLTD
jgi:hypothetical protein